MPGKILVSGSSGLIGAALLPALQSSGYEVTRLVRTRIGPLQDATLSPGASRQLSVAEVRRLMESVGLVEETSSTIPS